MRMLIAVTGLALVWGAGPACAQDQWDSPTEVGKIGFYACPTHPQIQATWPALCPVCRHVLQEAQPSATPALDIGLVNYRYRPPDNTYYGYGRGAYSPYDFPYGNVYGGRPYYNPSYGYYNPNTGYYFNPNTGYYYNPDTGDGHYAQNYDPNRYTFPYYRYASPYGYNYSNEDARARANRERYRD